MIVELYEYGLDNRLNDAVTLLRGAIGKGISIRDKDTRIGEAIGIIDTVRNMIIINEDDTTDDTKE